MDIGSAVVALRMGARVARQGWNGKGMWLALQVPDAHSKMSLPYVYMRTADAKLVPWLCSQTDLLAGDWEVVAEDVKPDIAPAPNEGAWEVSFPHRHEWTYGLS